MMGIWTAAVPLTAAVESDPPTPLIEQMAHTYTTPDAIASFLRTHFRFAQDAALFGEREHWQSPLEFLARRAGDCEDYALLARELLVRNGMEAFVFSLFGEEGYAHTVCVFVDRHGRYSIINQDRICVYEAPSLNALASLIYPAWTVGAVVERHGTLGRLVYEITNSRT